MRRNVYLVDTYNRFQIVTDFEIAISATLAFGVTTFGTIYAMKFLWRVFLRLFGANDE